MASLRDTPALVLLPAEERTALLEFWVDVAAALSKVGPPTAGGR